MTSPHHHIFHPPQIFLLKKSRFLKDMSEFWEKESDYAPVVHPLLMMRWQNENNFSDLKKKRKKILLLFLV